MPRQKDNHKPKGRMTAYAFFVQTNRMEHKKEYPEESVVFAEFSKRCGDKWKNISELEKRRFQEMAELDKKRFEMEMGEYVAPAGDKQKRRRRKRDPNLPKRSLSSFFWFCSDERSKIKGMNPEYGVGEVARELGRIWAQTGPEVKKKYQDMAKRDKARYEEEMNAYYKEQRQLVQQHSSSSSPSSTDKII